jgi:hypothetical protein
MMKYQCSIAKWQIGRLESLLEIVTDENCRWFQRWYRTANETKATLNNNGDVEMCNAVWIIHITQRCETVNEIHC